MTQARIEALVRQFDPLFESLVGGASEDRASIWGQSEQEANANPAAEEVKGSTHLGIGLIQWTGPRHTQLIQFAQSLGKPWQDTEAQVRFIGQELNGPYKHVWQQITTVATTLRSKTETAMGLYEDPSGWQDEIKKYGSTTAGMPRRLQGAQWAFSAIQQLKGTKVTDTSNVPATAPAAPQQQINVLADWIKKNEVAAETAIKGILVAKGVPGFVIDLLFNVLNPVIDQMTANLHPEDIGKLLVEHIITPFLANLTAKKA